MAVQSNGSVTGKAVVITGGTTGIGRATARLLAQRGARVLIFGRNKKDLDAAMSDINGDIHGIVADVTKTTDIKKVFAEADKRIGGVDILVNNAAVSGKSISEGSVDDWRQVIETNVLGYFA